MLKRLYAKLLSVWRIVVSNTFVIVTDRDAIVFSDFKGIKGALQLSSLKMIRDSLQEVIVEVENSLRGKKGTHGRNKGGRVKSRSNK